MYNKNTECDTSNINIDVINSFRNDYKLYNDNHIEISQQTINITLANKRAFFLKSRKNISRF